jgi:ketosteroid isomerase-like protein
MLGESLMRRNPPGILLSVLAMVLIMGACKEPFDAAKERETLLGIDREFSDYSVAHGAAEAFKVYLLKDALQLPAGEHPIHGRDAIYESMKPGDGSYTLSWSPEDGAVSRSNEMAYTWGIYTVTTKDAQGVEHSRTGKYLNVWRRNPEGNWRVAVDIGNPNPAED